MTWVERVGQYDASQRYRSNADMITLGEVVECFAHHHERTWCFRWWEWSMLLRHVDVVLQKIHLPLSRRISRFCAVSSWNWNEWKSREKISVKWKILARFSFQLAIWLRWRRIESVGESFEFLWNSREITTTSKSSDVSSSVDLNSESILFSVENLLFWIISVFFKNKIDFRVCFDLSTLPLYLSAHSIINSWKNKSSLCAGRTRKIK